MAEESLLETRKRLKLSRADVEKASGITQSKIVRIEKDGARTTDEERKQLADALAAFEDPTADDAPDTAQDPS